MLSYQGSLRGATSGFQGPAPGLSLLCCLLLITGPSVESCQFLGQTEPPGLWEFHVPLESNRGWMDRIVKGQVRSSSLEVMICCFLGEANPNDQRLTLQDVRTTLEEVATIPPCSWASTGKSSARDWSAGRSMVFSCTCGTSSLRGRSCKRC